MKIEVLTNLSLKCGQKWVSEEDFVNFAIWGESSAMLQNVVLQLQKVLNMKELYGLLFSFHVLSRLASFWPSCWISSIAIGKAFILSRHSFVLLVLSLMSIMIFVFWARRCPSLSALLVLVLGRLVSKEVWLVSSGVLWIGDPLGASREWSPHAGSRDVVVETAAAAFFFAKNCSCLILSRVLVLGDFCFTLLPRTPSDCRCFRAFWAFREKERVDPTFTVKQKSIFLESSCLAKSRQSFQGVESSAEARWSIVCLISKVLPLTRELPVSFALCKNCNHSAYSLLLRRQVPAKDCGGDDDQEDKSTL